MPPHSPVQLSLAEHKRKIVLVGNPNTGKSVVFQALTGRYVDVSNFPGTTVDVSVGYRNDDAVIDTPGVYGISTFNDEERVTHDVVLAADVVLNVVNATQLKRDLFLTLQLADMGIPMVVAVNMMDEAEREEIRIDITKLQRLIGVPVVPIAAVENRGMTELFAALDRAKVAPCDPHWLPRIDIRRPRAAQVIAIENSPGPEGETQREEIYLQRRQRVDGLFQDCVHMTERRSSRAKTLSRWMLRPVTGFPMLLATLFLIYLFIGVFVAQVVVDFMEEVVMDEWLLPTIIGFLEGVLSDGTLLGAVVFGDYGLLTMTVAYILGLLLPLVLGFYFMLALLEDSGYLPRIAALMDRLLIRMGLNGKAVIPMILGFGCVTMAVITTRVLETKRERTIATFLLSLAIPCSAQLGVIAALLAPLGIEYVVFYVVTVFLVYVLVGTLLNKILPGQSSHLFLDLPTLRLPRPGNVLQKTWAKTWHFLKEATPLFAVGSIIITLLDYFGLLITLQASLAPLTEGWLRLPRETATAFIMGVVRRDFGAAGLYDMNLDAVPTVISLITITLFVPCIASVLVIWKERGWKEWIGIVGGTFATAFLVGGVAARVLEWLP